MREIKLHFLVLLYVMAFAGVIVYFQRFEFGGQSFGLSLGEILLMLLAAMVVVVLAYSLARMIMPPPGHRWRFVFAGLMVIFVVLSRAGSPRSIEGLQSFYLRVLSALVVLNLAVLAVRRFRKEQRPPGHRVE